MACDFEPQSKPADALAAIGLDPPDAVWTMPVSLAHAELGLIDTDPPFKVLVVRSGPGALLSEEQVLDALARRGWTFAR